MSAVHVVGVCCVLGSVLCRDEAQKLWAERAALEAAGLKVVCVVHEWIDREVSGATERPAPCLSQLNWLWSTHAGCGQHMLAVVVHLGVAGDRDAAPASVSTG